jgi:hypothetical protein
MVVALFAQAGCGPILLLIVKPLDGIHHCITLDGHERLVFFFEAESNSAHLRHFFQLLKAMGVLKSPIVEILLQGIRHDAADGASSIILTEVGATTTSIGHHGTVAQVVECDGFLQETFG